MRRLALSSLVLTVTTPAFAHVGHVGETSGHSHYVAIGAAMISVSIAAGAIAAFKRSRNV